MEERWDRAAYQRDRRLTENPYEQNVSKIQSKRSAKLYYIDTVFVLSGTGDHSR